MFMPNVLCCRKRSVLESHAIRHSGQFGVLILASCHLTLRVLIRVRRRKGGAPPQPERVSICHPRMFLGLPNAIRADVHYMREAAMRLVACLTMCLMPILANAAHAQAPSNPQGYCVNRSAEFYPYTGEPCKSGYQLGSGNCR